MVKNEEILRWVFLSVLIVSILSSFIIPVFSEAQTQIWTKDWQGENRTDFEPDENVYIWGSGFDNNVPIDISITRPDNVIENYSIYSYENGWFLYIYTLDGMLGTYYVTATDNVNSASTTFEDSLKHLEGYDKAASRWERGLLEGWKELDWVPYRIKFTNLDNGTSNFNFKVCHNNLLDSRDGVDRLRNFRVGDVNGNPVNGSVIPSGPFYTTPGKNCDRDIYYSLSVTFTTPSSGLDRYVYWEAHVAFGASQWPGAKLHAYTENLTGSQDVPIKVPPTPVGSISGAKWNDLSYDGTWNPGEPGLSGWTIQLYFFDPVENSWINLDNKDTDVGGGYTFSKLVAGNYRLTEVLKANWVQTYPPSPGSHPITLSEGENRSGVNFGNILIVHGVEVSILPSYQSGSNGQTLNYTVTVANTGNVSDTYDLSVSDDLGWSPSVYPTWLTVPAGENRTATLSVRIPDNAMGSTQDNITVTATSREDSVSDSAVCAAKVLVSRGVDVSISPDNRAGVPCTWLEYTVTLTNTGNVDDTYNLSWADTQGWSDIWLEDNSLSAARCGGQNSTTLHVHIPLGAEGNTWNDITVTATSQENASIKDNDTCRANVNIARSVDVTISPAEDSGLPGESLSYIVAVKNTGNVPDNYRLENVDTLGWPLSLGRSLIEVQEGENQTTTLTVNIPGDARGCTRDNITVRATSQADNGVSDSASCTAHAENVYGVGVSILPNYQSGPPGSTLTYSVVVKNVGNVQDSYTLIATDNAGWLGPWTQELIDVPPGENRTKPLSVTIPDIAVPCTRDNIVVRATSHADNSVSAENSAIAHAAAVRDVGVSVSPIVDNGLIKDVIITNRGNVVDSYDLTAADNVGWILMLAENVVENVMPAENRMTTLHIKIPKNTKSGTVGGITVTATSVENAEVGDNASAQVTASRAVEVWIEPSRQSGRLGETLTYTAWVKNIGNVEDDNYYLSLTDELGWVENENFAGVSLDPNESNWVLFKVPIPENVEPKTRDVVTITTTSEIEPTVSDNASAIAAGPDLILYPDWNLVSFAIVNENTTKYNLFTEAGVDPLTVDMLWFDPYTGYHPVGLHEQLKDNLGYWVKPDVLLYITLPGEPRENCPIYLVGDWNLVGFPVVNENTTKYNLFTEAGVDPLTVDMLYFHPFTGYHPVGLHEQLKDVLGYYVKPENSVTIWLP